MLKHLMVIMACVCVTIVLSETTALIVLWQRGMLDSNRLNEARLVFTGETSGSLEDEGEPATTLAPTTDEIANRRSIKVMNLEGRERQLSNLSVMVQADRIEVETQRRGFLTNRDAFRKELAELKASITAEGVEQARGVLAKLPAEESVRYLMQLSLPDDVLILKGMSEKAIAAILTEFQAAGTQPNPSGAKAEGPTDSPAERGRKIFEALSRGDPFRSLVDEAVTDFGAPDNENSSTANTK
jgi:hypothetical protein